MWGHLGPAGAILRLARVDGSSTVAGVWAARMPRQCGLSKEITADGSSLRALAEAMPGLLQTKACRVAFAVQAVRCGVTNFVPSFSPLVHLLELAENAFGKESASEQDSNHTVSAFGATQFGVEAPGEVVGPRAT